jgi:DNA invertase Pin-like site-specific DNA recombinase
MKVGYARTSTTEQIAGLDAQVRDLKQAGCEKLFAEQVSSVGQREQLAAALDFIREGDTLVVTKLDRLARSIGHLSEITKALETKKANLQVLAMGLDTSTATGRLMLNVIGSVAQFEREMMLERQREGIAKAKLDGKYKGRKATARAKATLVSELHERGLGATEIARQVGIGRASVYRILEHLLRCATLDNAVHPSVPSAEAEVSASL